MLNSTSVKDLRHYMYLYKDKTLWPGVMENGKNCTKGYLFAFNGQEKDDEIFGSGNTYSAEHWQYSPRLGRRFNLDPVYKSNRSNYSVLSNSPIIFVDPLGDDDFYNKAGKYVESIGTGTAIRVINKMNVSSAENFKAAMKTPETKALIEASPVVKIQENQQQAIAGLYNNNNKPGATEKVAYAVLDVEKATLTLVTINASSDNNSTSKPHESHLGGLNGDYNSIEGDKYQVIVGQIHTHPPNADGSPPASKVSEEGGLGIPKTGSDVTAAKKLKVPVHAVDNNNIHKVSSDGTIKNNLPKNTEILKSSLEESGGKK